MNITVRYYLSEGEIRRRLISTGEQESNSRRIVIDLTTITPAQREQLLTANDRQYELWLFNLTIKEHPLRPEIKAIVEDIKYYDHDLTVDEVISEVAQMNTEYKRLADEKRIKDTTEKLRAEIKAEIAQPYETTIQSIRNIIDGKSRVRTQQIKNIIG